ncbi:MAG: hypothetical protein MK096_08585 [Oleiphilaceae bacterium]|nr:hypothetical protein [Oleiphilaceae bacterium]
MNNFNTLTLRERILTTFALLAVLILAYVSFVVPHKSAPQVFNIELPQTEASSLSDNSKTTELANSLLQAPPGSQILSQVIGELLNEVQKVQYLGSQFLFEAPASYVEFYQHRFRISADASQSDLARVMTYVENKSYLDLQVLDWQSQTNSGALNFELAVINTEPRWLTVKEPSHAR